jgi:hypothetical protein
MKNIHVINQNIYITNDEEIKEGDWVIYKNKVFKIGIGDNELFHLSKKIILTTDQDLIKDGVQAIEDDFLEWFVQNPSCEEVEVQCRYNFYAGQDLTHYKIIIPKESKLINNCPKCGLDLIIREHCTPICTDIDCRGIILSNETLREWASKKESKQETLEEAMESYLDSPTPHSYKRAVKFGANWQQKQILEFLYLEITERRDYSASKMCEKVIEFIEQLNTKK